MTLTLTANSKGDFDTLRGVQGVNMLSGQYSFGQYPSSTILAGCKSAGYGFLRLHTAWERLQPTLNAALDAGELSNLITCLDACAANGLRVILVPMNSDALYDPNYGSDDGSGPPNYTGGVFSHSGGARQSTSPTSYKLGSVDLTSAMFADFWTRLATGLKDHTAVVAYDLINEPVSVDQGNPLGADWVTAAQAAVTAIRAVDTITAIIVPGDYYSSAEAWAGFGGNNTLNITDSANNLIYEAHQYFDNGSSNYVNAYDSEPNSPYSSIPQGLNRGALQTKPFVDWCISNGFRGFIGEWGVPGASDARYLTQAENFLAYCNANNIVTCCHFYYVRQSEPSFFAASGVPALLNVATGSNPQTAAIMRHNSLLKATF